MHEELRRRVRQALTQLPTRDREIIVLRFFEQLSTKDAANVLGITVAAAKSRQLRAVARLQEILGDTTSEDAR
jgi:RNA polymerase sigma factor (sigma-70 family)